MGARRAVRAVRKDETRWTNIAYRTRAGSARATSHGVPRCKGNVPCGGAEGGSGDTEDPGGVHGRAEIMDGMACADRQGTDAVGQGTLRELRRIE